MNDEKIPNHVAIILDGNRRWAKRQGMIASLGHKAGFENLKKLSTYILERGVKVLSVFAFSTENFKRSKDEVDYLMNLFTSKFKGEIPYFNRKNVKVVFSGRNDDKLSDAVKNAMKELSDATSNNTGGVFNICLNYGGRAEIVDTCKKICEEYKNNKLDINEIDEDLFQEYLYQDLPPIDLMIRTSGECRISNFMLYSLSYAELVFTDKCFPEFNEEEFEKALIDYQNRNITKGGNKS